MDYFIDYLGNAIALDEEVKNIVFDKHPEVKRLFDRMTITLADPDLVKE